MRHKTLVQQNVAERMVGFEISDKKVDLKAFLPAESTIEKYFDRLWPLCRSITGNGFRQSLAILQEIIPLRKVEVPTGTPVLDWTIPEEWNISDAYVMDSQGRKVIDFKKNNLHVLGYSEPVDTTLPLAELQNHLYSIPEKPNAIPYLTSYYKRRWGFCLTHRDRMKLKAGTYRAVIKSTLKKGSLTYGHLILPATERSQGEILLSTYLCHPSMANNELSGPLVVAFLYQALKKCSRRRFSYRFVFAPETIGTIAYLSRYGRHLKKYCRAGLIATCCGDDYNFTYLKSRPENSLIDKCAQDVLRNRGKKFFVKDYNPFGSDERQYGSPGYNLPVGSLMRSVYGTYKEYHTSLDNKSFISFKALRETIEVYLTTLLTIEANETYRNTSPYGEPMLSKRGLYPTLGSVAQTETYVQRLLTLLNFSDGEHDLCEIAQKAGCSVLDLTDIVKKLVDAKLLVTL